MTQKDFSDKYLKSIHFWKYVLLSGAINIIMILFLMRIYSGMLTIIFYVLFPGFVVYFISRYLVKTLKKMYPEISRSNIGSLFGGITGLLISSFFFILWWPTSLEFLVFLLLGSMYMWCVILGYIGGSEKGLVVSLYHERKMVGRKFLIFMDAGIGFVIALLCIAILRLKTLDLILSLLFVLGILVIIEGILLRVTYLIFRKQKRKS